MTVVILVIVAVSTRRKYMRNLIKNSLLTFGAGCAGGLANSLVVWAFGHWGLTAALGVHISPHISPAWLYPRIVWGGIWGLAFLLPLMPGRLLSKGLVLSLGPTIIQLFVVFPLKAHKGTAGLDLGLYTPLFVLFFNAVWGLKTAILLRLARFNR